MTRYEFYMLVIVLAAFVIAGIHDESGVRGADRGDTGRERWA